MSEGKDAASVRLHWDNFNPRFRTAAGVVMAIIGLLAVSCFPNVSWLWLIPVFAAGAVSLVRSELTLWPQERRYRLFAGILGLERARTGTFDDLAGWEIDRVPKTEFSGHDHSLRLKWKTDNSTFTLPFPNSLYNLSAEARDLAQITGLPIIEGPGIQAVSATSLPHRVP